MASITSQTLRIPKGMWDDLEQSVIQQDRLFLTEVARSLGLPVQEVIRKCLGTSGASTVVPVLWMPPESDDAECCPWWECHGEGLWRRCPRARLSPTMPCYMHERFTPCPLTRLQSDPYIKALPWRIPWRRDGTLYWIDPDRKTYPLHEDGRIESNYLCRVIDHRGTQTVLWYPLATEETSNDGQSDPDDQ